ncbi:HAD family hydrolase [Latilactobacillus graminis]|uniref:HAD-superhydrolase, subIA, variant 3 family protein n=2 Tax=Latilactobacillus graminis TaxID=60519 RepID=A0AA89I0H3_9LACO|nr:HAD family phosphatase [Latilactobacillus graminis]KRM22288.1 HAD-superhydrolase, subIA, variant 3 family protein [Latilactobacillus graminis DSM 20719]QFP79536.1 HAD family phosphatase [Latilactobacillus graminis]
MTTKGIIFDMDGLLVDSEKIYYQANVRAAKEMGFAFTPADHQAILGTTDAYLRNYFKQKLGSADAAAEFIDRSYRNVAAVIATDGVAIKPGLVTLLDYSDAHGINRVIASSNFRSMVDDFMQSTGLQARFDQVVAGDEVTHGKPHPEIFLKALDKLALPAANALVLEDSPNGVMAANQAAIPVIMIPDLIAPTEVTQQQTLATVADLAQVIPYLEK